MRARSISRRLIASVLVLELLSALALAGISVVHEMHVRFRAFDTTLRARADSLIGAVGDAEDEGDHLVLNTVGITVPARDLFEVKDEETGRVLGRSPQWPAEQLKTAENENGVLRFEAGGREYHLVRAQGVRTVDADQAGSGIVHHVTALYGGPTEHVWGEVWEAVRFYALASVLLLAITGCGMAWFLRRQLAPLRALAAEAARVSARQWQFTPPESARVTRELAPLTQAIEATLARLQQSFEQQERFTSDAAHELKTDVAIAKSSLQLLAMRSRSVEEYKHGLDVCLRDCLRLENTVQEMLALAGVQYASRGADSSTAEIVDLAQCARDAVTKFASLAELRGVHVSLSATDHADVQLDAKECDLLCSNLLLNALQHSSSGSDVRIEISRNDEWLQMSIEDHGEGIAPEILPHVFEPFFRGDPSRDRNSGGTGLGLSICKAVCDHAGGSIEIKSTVGSGSRVIVRMPHAPAGSIESSALLSTRD
jgi:signal transduction histidine kinase